MTSINRRETMALTGAGLMAALTASAVTATAAPASSATPVRALFAEWQKIQDMFDADVSQGLPGEEADKLIGGLVDQQNAILRRLMDLPICEPGDFAMKIVAVTGYGDYEFDEWEDRIFADARAVIAQAA